MNPQHPKSERLNAIIHLLGVVFVIVFGPFLWSQGIMSPVQKAGMAIYLLSFIGVFGFSAMYHINSDPTWDEKLKFADHVWIYLFIAGTNAVFITAYANNTKGYTILAALYLLAFIGIILKACFLNTRDWLSLFYYLLIGWLGGFTIYLIYDKLNGVALTLIITGGLLYTIGTYFYKYDHKKWFHEIWHSMVLLGAIAHFCALLV